MFQVLFVGSEQGPERKVDQVPDAEAVSTGPAQDNNIVADLVSGDAKVGDTVRDQ